MASLILVRGLVDRPSTTIPMFGRALGIPSVRRRVHAHDHRKAFQHGAVALVVVRCEAALQGASKRAQPRPFPPAIDVHHALSADLDRQLAAVVAVGVLVDSGVVHRSPSGILHGR